MLIISHSRGIIKDCRTIGNKIYTIREKFKKRLAKSFVLWYNNMVRRDIEAVITGLTRNRVGRFPEWPRKPLILLASSAFLHFFKTEYLRFFYALSTISTPGSQSAGNPQSLENTAWRCIEVVVTRLTRNQLTGQTVRGFESLHLRQSLQW